MSDFALARHNMVESQIRPNQVTDGRLLAALEETPREQFVPGGRQGIAYVDEDIPLGHGRWLMEPMVLARLIQLAAPAPGELALDIGCGTGYASAILSRLCDTVVGLESEPELAADAIRILGDLAIDNVAVVEGALEAGAARQGPFDVIFFGGAVPRVPDAIAAQLATGGRMVAVVRSGPGIGQAMLWSRRDEINSHRAAFDAAVPPLPGFQEEAGFVF